MFLLKIIQYLFSNGLQVSHSGAERAHAYLPVVGIIEYGAAKLPGVFECEYGLAVKPRDLCYGEIATSQEAR
jgi:hypothetical protein